MPAPASRANSGRESVFITAGRAGTPAAALATNVRVPESSFAAFPKRETVMPE